MKVLLTGGTGFVGQRLAQKLENCVVTTRDIGKARARLGGRATDAIQWKSTTEELDLERHRQFSAVVNLMGEPIADKRWNDAQKNQIRSSRVDGTRRIVEAVVNLETRPEVFVSASAVAIYGDCGDEVVTEDHAAADDFLADVCKQWESATSPLSDKGIRVVIFRIGIVLGAEGGALRKLIPLFNVGLGGKLGSGRHFLPWIHVDDVVDLILWSIATKTVHGRLNATAPNPVRNSEFTTVLGKALGRPALVRAPKFALKLLMGEFADCLLASQRVVPAAALAAGFEFRFPTLNLAIGEIVNS